MQSGNPALNKNTFLDAASGSVVAHGEQVMTINGTINRTGFLLILVLVGAMYSWSQFGGVASMPAMAPAPLLPGAITATYRADSAASAKFSRTRATAPPRRAGRRSPAA